MVEQRDTFYVNYLPVPASLRRFLWLIAGAMVAITLGIAGAIAAVQRDPGSGEWRLDAPVELEGVLVAQPYPMLIQLDEERVVALVGEGKLAANIGDVTTPVVARVRGNIITRDGKTLLEIAGPDAVTVVVTTDQHPTVAPTKSARVELSGQIIDPKCYFGVMKPGEGITHKACAALCLRGGIPPMFMTQQSDGARRYHLLLDAKQGPVTGADLESLIDVVGEPVSIAGVPSSFSGVSTLAVDHVQRR